MMVMKKTMLVLWGSLVALVLVWGCGASQKKTSPQVVQVVKTPVNQSPEHSPRQDESSEACAAAAREKLAKARGIRYCYEKELPRNPNLAGEISTKLEIDASGTLVSATLAGSTMGNENVENCILKKIKRVKFAACPGDETMEFIYPWAFK